MRKQLLLVLVAAGASACAARPSTNTTLANIKPSAMTYICAEDQQVRREGTAVFAGRDHRLPLGWQDHAGDHFVAFPLAAASEAVEYVMPDDPLSNAVENVYDTSGGRAQSDWRLKSQRVCTVKGGYTFALASLSAGKSLDDIAGDLGIDRAEAKKVVYNGLMKALTSYHKQIR